MLFRGTRLRGVGLGDAVEIQPADLGCRGQVRQELRATHSSLLRTCSESVRGPLASLAPPGVLWAPGRLSSAAQTFPVLWPWRGACRLALDQILFLLLRNVPWVTFGVERLLTPLKPPQLQP